MQENNTQCCNTQENVEQAVNRLLQDAFSARPQDAESAWLPEAELEETAESMNFRFELPGVPKEAVNLEIKEGELVISGDKTLPGKQGEILRRYSEVAYGHFARTVRLEKGLLASKASASMKDGVLTVSIPRAEEAKPVKVKID